MPKAKKCTHSAPGRVKPEATIISCEDYVKCSQCGAVRADSSPKWGKKVRQWFDSKKALED